MANKKDNWWQNLGTTLTAPVGGFTRGVLRGLAPGLAEYNDLQKEAMRQRYETYGLRGIIDAIRTSGGDINIAKEILSDDPRMQELIAALDPLRGFTEEQKLQARLYESGVKSRPGAQPWETYGLENEKSLKDYAARLRHGKLQSSIPVWEREEYVPPPEEPEKKPGDKSLGGLILPLQEQETEPPPLPTPLPTSHKSFRGKGYTGTWTQPELVGPPNPYSPITQAEIAPIFEKAQKNGISRLKLFADIAKLKDLKLNHDEVVEAYNFLAGGGTVEEIRKYIKSGK